MSKLYPCVNCTEDGYCKKYSDEEVKSWCVQSPCEYERPSNADRIRNMTDEELAEWINRLEPFKCHKGYKFVNGCWEDETDCIACILEWLKQEVET